MPEIDVAEADAPKTLWADSAYLGSQFLGGIIGNLAAALAWEVGKYVAKPLVERIPELSELLRNGGHDQNHDLLRALRRAESAALVEVLNACILEHSGLQIDPRSAVELLRARWRARSDPMLDTLCRLRRAFKRLHSDLATMRIGRLLLLNGGALDSLPALIDAGTECFAGGDIALTRERVVSDQIAWLGDAVTGPARFAGIAQDDLGAIAPAGVPAILVERLRRHPEGWWDFLRLAFREELKDPKNTRARAAWDLDILSRLRAQLGGSFVEMSARLDGIDAKLQAQWDALRLLRDEFDRFASDVIGRLEGIEQRVDQVLAQLREQFTIDGKPVFFQPRIGDSARFGLAYKPFYFAEEEDPFLGRRSVLEALRHELLNPSEPAARFRWAAICGDAGTGKSRLGLHIIGSECATWPFSGFVRSEFIQSAAHALTTLADIPGPTLFVIDYTAGAPEACCRFIERCSALASTALHPVRALVLLRRSSDRFFEAVARQNDGAAALNAQISFPPPPSQRDDRSGALILGGLGDEDTRTLMAHRIARASFADHDRAGETRAMGSDSVDLLAMLRRYDPLMRPLFAAMVADAFARGLLPGPGAEIVSSHEEARLQLFWDYLEHQYLKRWSVFYTGLDDVRGKDRVDRHLSFLILSTMCRGLTADGWDRLHNDATLGASAAAMMPMHPLRFDALGGELSSQLLDEEHLLAALSGATRGAAESDAYPILEPDLIGESLALLLFEERGKALCGQPGTAERRRKLLRDQAWCADPGGAAFFSMLVAQDFPEHAAKADWLLPQFLMPNAAAERAHLFRNLALATVAPLRTRAAIDADIHRMEQLLARFPLDAGSAEEMQTAHAAAIEIIAEQLRFVINKRSAPVATEVAPIPDKLGKRTLSFSAAASAGVAATTNDSEVKRQPTQYSRSDRQTAVAATALLRRLFDQAIEPTFSSRSFELRLQHAETLCHALASIFWEHRNVSRKHGFAAAALTPPERQARHNLGSRCVDCLAVENPSEATVALAAHVTRGLIFAEDGSDSNRGRPIYAAILSFHERKSFGDPLAVTMVLGFLDEYLSLSIQGLLHRIEPSELAETAPPFAELATLAAELFERATAHRDVPRRLVAQLNKFWCTISCQLAHVEVRSGRGSLAVLQAAVDTFERATNRLEGLPVTAEVIDLYSRLLAACRTQGAEVSEALSTYAAIVDAHGFDLVSTNAPGWTGLAEHLAILRDLAPLHWLKVRPLFELAVRQIGERARRELCDVLLSRLPSHVATEADVQLAMLAQGEAATAQQSVGSRMLALAMMSQRLIEGENQSVLAELEAMWSQGTDDQAFAARTEVMLMLPLLLAWLGHDDPDVRLWRNRLAALFHKAGAAVPSSRLMHNHHSVAVATAAWFAEREIASGRAADDWLPEGVLP